MPVYEHYSVNSAIELWLFTLQGTDETVRVVSMDKDFHVDCFHCEVWFCLACNFVETRLSG